MHASGLKTSSPALRGFTEASVLGSRSTSEATSQLMTSRLCPFESLYIFVKVVVVDVIVLAAGVASGRSRPRSDFDSSSSR